MITVGCDPEFFIKVGDSIVASQGIIPGTKQEPEYIDGGAIHRDNILGELAMIPAESEDEFVYNLDHVIQQAQDILSPIGGSMEWSPSAMVSDECLMHYEAMEFGCDPDIDCWSVRLTEPPDPLMAGNLRSAGGHVHVGFEYVNEQDQINAARSMDFYLGLPSVLFDRDILRRNLYGKSGRFRFKPYGIEYRTLSNAWLNSEELKRWVFRQAIKAVSSRNELPEFTDDMVLELQRIINESDKDAAEQWVNKYNIEVPKYA